VVNVIKFRCALNFFLLATPAVVDTSLVVSRGKRLPAENTMRLAQVEKLYAENGTQNILLLGLRILMLVEKRRQNL
jgi:hypothetical protein